MPFYTCTHPDNETCSPKCRRKISASRRIDAERRFERLLDKEPERTLVNPTLAFIDGAKGKRRRIKHLVTDELVANTVTITPASKPPYDVTQVDWFDLIPYLTFHLGKLVKGVFRGLRRGRHNFTVKPEVTAAQRKYLERFLRDPEVFPEPVNSDAAARALMNYACSQGHLKPGKYSVEIWW